MAKTSARERNKERRRVYQDVLRHARTLTSSLSKAEIVEKAKSALDNLNIKIGEIASLEGRTDLTNFQKDFLAVKYEEAAEKLERVAYLAIAFSEPLSASIYFQEAYECYLDGMKYPNKFISHDVAMESLREMSVACAYEDARRKNSCRNFFRN